MELLARALMWISWMLLSKSYLLQPPCGAEQVTFL